MGRQGQKCPYGAEISVETSLLRPEIEGLKLQPRCVYCKVVHEAERANILREERIRSRPAGTCLARGTDCTKTQTEGSDYCEEHEQAFRNTHRFLNCFDDSGE